MKRALLILSLVFPILFACIYSITVSRLYVYYDMGVNATANLGEIFFITLPTMLILFFVTLGATKLITNKLNFSYWKIFSSEIIFQLLVFSIVFLHKFESLRNYPVSKPYNIIHFFTHFFDG
jgi:hypothetical protein